MSEPTINDLRVQVGQVDIQRWLRPLTPAEFADIARDNGYLKLDPQTIERLRWFSEGRANDETVLVYEVHNLINPILAALTPEEDT